MRKIVKSLIPLLSFTGVSYAETLSWQLERDNLLDGVVDSVNAEFTQLQLEFLANNFIGALSETAEVDFISGNVEQRNNISNGAGNVERIKFRFSKQQEVIEYLGHGDFLQGFTGTWYGPNGESGDFNLVRVEIPESQSLVPTLSSNDSASPITISSSSSHNSVSNNVILYPWKAFNENTSSWKYGQCFEGKSGWIKVDFYDAKFVTSYTMRGRDDATSFSFKSWTFEGSNDDVNWTVIHQPEDQTAWQSGEVREFNTPTSMYRYYRWNVASNNGGNLACSQELRIYGY